MGHNFPVIALFKSLGSKESHDIEKKLIKYLVKTEGKFRLALIDIDANPDIRKSLKVSFVPSLFLMYRHNIA